MTMSCKAIATPSSIKTSFVKDKFSRTYSIDATYVLQTLLPLSETASTSEEGRDVKVVVGQAFIDSGEHEVLISLNGGKSLDGIQVASTMNPNKPV